MKQNNSLHTLYALDFDGVICDSAIETAITGYRAATHFWPEMAEAPIHTDDINAFKHVRPHLETGYEAILIMRALYLGVSVNTLCLHYDKKLNELIRNNQLGIAELKHSFALTRDQWIDKDLQDWLNHNPLFDGIANALRHIAENSAENSLYILTTKQERFVKHILHNQGISLPDDQIYGMQHSKQDVLEKLIRDQPQPITFLEDRLPTLLKVAKNPALQAVTLQLADWGYNSEQDRQQAHKHGIEVIRLSEFIQLHTA